MTYRDFCWTCLLTLGTSTPMLGCDGGAGTGAGDGLAGDAEVSDARIVLLDSGPEAGGGDATTRSDATPGCVPTSEVCNDADDDCDGRVDEADPQMETPCDTGLPGSCGMGAQRCMAGELRCVQTVQPADEVCDAIDNDCDGAVNEGVTGEACETGERGICGPGIQVCVSGAFECRSSEMPRDEVCNGLDDDCDGTVDGPGSGCGCVNGMPDVRAQAMCGNGQAPDEHIGECAEDTELHFIGQMNVGGGPDANGVEFTEVHVQRTVAPISLVLSSYQSTEWRVITAPGVQLRQIILNGFIESRLLDPPQGVELFDLTGEARTLTACAFRWPQDNEGCDTPLLVMHAEELTGLTLTSFQGCHTGVSFMISTRPE